MEANLPIQFVTRTGIDADAWDRCIEQSLHSRIYARSFFLDNMSANWDALIAGDYEWVMPLTWKRKYLINYLYQPAFCQQLGIFGRQAVPQSLMVSFLQAATERFKFAEIFLNSGNEYAKAEQQPNFVLPMNRSFEIMESRFSSDLRKNLKHASKFSLVYEHSNDCSEAIHHYRQQYAERTPGVGKQDYENFNKLCAQAAERQMLLVRKVIAPSNELHAIAVFLKDKKRLYNLMSTTLPAGRQSEANHLLFAELIREFANSHYTLDFEGSTIPGIANFYQKFGAQTEHYYFFRYNHLPWPISLLKKNTINRINEFPDEK